MNISIPFYNFIMFLVVGTLFIVFAIAGSDKTISITTDFLQKNQFNDITTIKIISFISIAYICGYMISRLGSICDLSKFCNEKTIGTYKLYRWNDAKLIVKAKKYPILYTYAREYSFCRTLTTMFFLLALLSGCSSDKTIMFIICGLISLVSTLKGLNKVNNAIEDL